MRGLQIIPYNTKIDFAKHKTLSFVFALLIVCISFASLFTKGLNLGIDFKGGILLEVRTAEKADISSMRASLNQLGLGDVKLQDYGSDRDVLIRVEQQDGDEKAQGKAVALIKSTLSATYGNDIDYRKIESVGAKVSEDLISNGVWAVTIALVGMLFYIWVRFEWEYGLSGVLSLLQDAIAVLGFYSLSGLEFNESAIAAILTTIGYSINDSVVIYDRLRENLRKFKTTPIPEVINLSINGTLSRTILTSGSTLLALCALYWFGGPVIENFSLPIIVGICFGTFSSILLSVNLLQLFDLRKKREEEPVASGPQ